MHLSRVILIASLWVASGARAQAGGFVPDFMVQIPKALTARPIVLEGKGTGVLHYRSFVVRLERDFNGDMIAVGGVEISAKGMGSFKRQERMQLRSGSEPTVFRIKIGAEVKDWRVALADRDFRPVLDDVYDHPGADAPFADRMLGAYSLINYNNTTSTLVHELFMKVDESFFVYPKDKLECADERRLLVNEPVIVQSANLTAALGYWVARANGDFLLCSPVARRGEDSAGPIESYFSLTKPAKVVMPPPARPVQVTGPDFDVNEEFLDQADDVPRIARYVQLKQKMQACSEAAWEALDPNKASGQVSIVEMDRRGEVVKSETIAAKIQRKVDARCNLPAMRREREAIRAELAKASSAESARQMALVQARFMR
jgi:hypothetical protein